MDGKIFFRSSVTPPPGTYFAFDLQRFDDQTITWKIGSSGTETTGTFSEFKTAAESANDIIFLSSDLTLESDLQLNRSISINASDVTLDLAGYEISKTASGSIAALGIIMVNKAYGASLGASLKCDDSVTPSLTVKDSSSEGTGKITDTGYTGIGVYGNETEGSASLTVEGGTIKGKWFGISGNASASNGVGLYGGTVINIKGGSITQVSGQTTYTSGADGGFGIYNPQDNSKLTISGGSISGDSGVEIRAGSLEITGGTITATYKEYLCDRNGGGSTTTGAAISIPQHVTKKDINVNISGGEMSGAVALSVANPQENTEDAKPVEVEITGGTFESTNTGANAIAAQNSDERATINVSNATFKGKIETSNTFATTTEEKSANINITGPITVVTKTVAEDGTVTETSVTYDEDSALKYKDNDETTLTVSEGWNNIADDWRYLVRDATDLNYAKSIATLAPPATGDAAETTLNLTTTGTQTIELDLTDTRFSGFSAQTILDASTATSPLNIKASDKIKLITSGAGADSLTAGAAGVSLNGGAGNDLLTGGDGADTFIFTAGKDTIAGYDKEDDLVSIGADLTAPIDFDNVSYDGSDFAISLGSDDNVLTFQSTEAFSITNGTDTYSYAGNKNGIESIAKEGDGISLGAGFTSKNYNGTELNYQTIDARKVTGSLTIRGNDATPGSSLFGAIGGGAVYGGMNADTLQSNATIDSIGTILDGGDGADLLIGGGGRDTFVYSAGADTVQDYGKDDLINIKGVNISDATYSVEGDNISLDFGNGDSLVFNAFDSGVSVKANGGNYIYTKDYYSHNGNSVILAKDYTGPFNGLANTVTAEYVTINAAAVSGNVSIVGNDKNNNIIGSATATAGTLYGGKGNDKLDVTERATGAKFVLQYTEGKDTVEGFVAGDTLDIDDTLVSSISKAKSSKGGTKLEFTFGKSKVLTFKGDEEIASVSLQEGTGFLTKDGVVTFASASDTGTDTSGDTTGSTGTDGDATEGTGTDGGTTGSTGTDGGTTGSTETAAATTAVNSLKLFASARGKIDLTEAPYASADIASVNATAVKKQSVTMIGGADGGTFTFADKNKKKDQFNYGGGDVTISNYESGIDKLELGTASLSGFKVTNDGKDVSLNAGGETISLVGAAGSEIMLHHAGSTRSSFTKMVFAADNVILNKSKRPTMATVSGSYDATNDSTVKKIFATSDIAAESSIKAGDKAKTTIDASAANGVTLVGGAKNDKLIGSTSSLIADTFVYTGGKDIIENYNYSGDSGDKISIGNFDSSLTSAKISAGKRSIKFKFGSKDALTIKPAKGASLGGSLNISGVENYTYSKNAIADGNSASLTSAFSGSYKLKDKGITNVDGALVEKNLTYKGTSAAETLSGGTKKTTFKGGGGADSFTGGTGKDIFFYAKGDKGDATIANFDVSSDKVKIASGTITKISSDDGKITFDMNSGRKGSANIGSFQINNITNGYDANGNTVEAGTRTLIKANNTYLWFADEGGTDVNGDSFAKGALITRDTKVSKSETSEYAVIDLGYSTNLVKAGVAYKVENATWSSGSTNNQTNNSGN